MKWFEVFKAGKHADSAGRVREWTLADLSQIAKNFGSGNGGHQAPMVLGHPKDNSPAYGWIKGLKVEGDKLLALPVQVNEKFKEWVKQGLYKTRSISLYPDLTLRHVGFLGAFPPAVKGLADVQFGEPAGGSHECYEFTDNPAQPEPKDKMELYCKLPDGSIYDTKAKKVVTPEDVSYKAWLAQGNKPCEMECKTEAPAAETNHQEAAPKAAPATGANNHAEKNPKVLDLERQVADLQKTGRQDRAKSFCEGLVTEGRLSTDQARGLAEYMANTEVAAVELNFAEGKKPAHQFLMEFLARLPKRGHLEPIGPGQVAEFAEDDKIGQKIAEMSGFGPKKS